jgi:hypothetical protein
LSKQFARIPKSNTVSCSVYYEGWSYCSRSIFEIVLRDNRQLFRHGDSVELNASCIMIYDTVANRFVSNSGYVSVDLPPRGSVAGWDVYVARYIGRG